MTEKVNRRQVGDSPLRTQPVPRLVPFKPCATCEIDQGEVCLERGLLPKTLRKCPFSMDRRRPAPQSGEK